MDAGCLSPVRFRNPIPKNSNHPKRRNKVYSVRPWSSPILALLLSSFLLAVPTRFVAQIGAGRPKHVHGSIVSFEGEPVADATVEIRDLRGIPLGSSFSDISGRFEIYADAVTGQYMLLASKGARFADVRIVMDQPDLAVAIVLPFKFEIAGKKPLGQTVSVKQLSIPAKAWTHLAAAQKQFNRLDLATALKEMDTAIRADPAFAQALSMRAFVKVALRDFWGAVQDAQRGISLDPDDAESYVALGTAYNSLNEFRKAENAVEQALSIQPDSWQAQLELAKSLYGQGRFVLALWELDAVGRDFPDVHLVRGNVLMRLDRGQEAAEQFGLFISEAPGDPRKEQIKRIIAMELAAEQQSASVANSSPR